jgi:uncharacterized protein YdeI (YjbR/CyaY-like superfamily)
MDPRVEAYFENTKKWNEESKQLRSILLRFPLEEELKWAQPCYTFRGKNVVLIGGFKDYVALLFVKGALIADPKHILATPGSTQAGRQIRFSSLREITAMKSTVQSCIAEAIEVEKSGRKVQLRTHAEYKMPPELQKKLDAMPHLKKAFYALTPGRQRGYMLHVADAKQSKTRESRVEKCTSRILDGKGLLD